MRGIDLRQFRFNYDLTLALVAMNADGTVYTTYAGRTATGASSHQSTGSLAAVLAEAMERHKSHKPRKPSTLPPTRPPTRPPTTVEDLAWWKRDKREHKCFHCHMVHDAMQQEGRRLNRWTERDQFSWPDPMRVGLRLDREQQTVVAEAIKGSPAAKAGLRKGDRIVSIGGAAPISFGDIQQVLQDAGWGPVSVPVTWQRGSKPGRGTLRLRKGWRRPSPEEYAWRSMKWAMSPKPGFGGPPLTAEEKRRLGIAEESFAFRVGYIVTWGKNAETGRNARRAGIRKGTIVLSVAGKNDFRDMGHFHAWFRMTRRPGERVPIEVIQNETRKTLTLTTLP